MHKISRDDGAVVSIDMMVAMVLVMMAVLMAIQVIPAVSHEDRDWRIKQYMTAVRASDSLVKDEGTPLNWDVKWTSGDYSNVTKIGLVDNNSLPNTLNESKINALMTKYTDPQSNLSWWEFPPNFTTSTQAARDSASRALGLKGYNFYMQLHPVGLNNSFESEPFDYNPLVRNLTNRNLIPINNDTAAAIDRYVYIRNDPCGGSLCYWNATNGANITVHYRLNLWVWQ